ncbi:MAG: hypothetical protein Q4D98_10920 [Planctomycetia bacterium]|nr:hypothetical protein [Planctomycetia bacterium]
MSNTSRTATEQLLLSDAMDRAVSQADFSALSGKNIFIDSTPIESFTDHKYLLSLVRQHAFASGCRIVEKKEDAEFIVELRAGVMGTDQHDTLIGVTEMTLPTIGGYGGTSIPEIAMAKKTLQKAVVKIGIFAYTNTSHRPVWQSGNLVAESRAKNRWLFGMGPYQTGEIYTRVVFDGSEVNIPLVQTGEKESVPLGEQVFFEVPEEDKESEEEVAQADEKKPETTDVATNDAPAGKLEEATPSAAVGAQANVPPTPLPTPKVNALSPPPVP